MRVRYKYAGLLIGRGTLRLIALKPENLFFIYVAKNDEWQIKQRQDWDYVASMARFFKWWIRRYFDIEIHVEADILPVIPGRLFDRMSVAYLIRDHSERGSGVFHFYLAYFKPFWTDCNTEGYTARNLGVAWWQTADSAFADSQRNAFYAESNCPRVSHILVHELLRLKGKTKKNYFGKVHDLWDKHIHHNLPYLYFDSKFERVSKTGGFKFATLDAAELSE